MASPQVGNRYDVDVTAWVDGVIRGTDSVSNGILLLAADEDGVETDYFGIRNIWPFYGGEDRLVLKVWISDWDWITVRLDSGRVDDGWIGSGDPDTIISTDGVLKTGTGSGTPLPGAVAVIFPDDSALFGPDAIPVSHVVDSARLWLYAASLYLAPDDTVAVGEFLPPVRYVAATFPTWDSAGDGIRWADGQWSVNDHIRRDARLVSGLNRWYSWSVGAMIRRWHDSAATRHGFALWDAGPSTNQTTAWIDRTLSGFGARAGSLRVWISPRPPHIIRRAWIDSPAILK